MNLTHRFKTPLLRRGLRCLALAIGSVTVASAAVTWHDVQFGGFASQGFLANTGDNDYLGETSDGTFDFREYAVNASWSKGKFRVGAQAFGQKLGEYGDDKIKLDWAIVDYQVTQWFGIRAGRVKMPRGLYNEALDLDMVRPQILMPQSVYDARLRDFNASFDGAMIYGNVAIGKAGSFDYKLFYGDIPMSNDSGAADYFTNTGVGVPSSSLRVGMDSVSGGSVFWNTPISGLRTGYSYNAFKAFSNLRRFVHPQLGTFNSEKVADSYQRHLLSIEYTRGDWLVAAEIGREKAAYSVISAIALIPASGLNFESNFGYVSATRRLTPKFALGTYYSHSVETNEYIGTLPAGVAKPILPDLRQDDYAVSLQFDATEHLVLKIEGHYLDGAGKIFDTLSHPQPFAQRDNSWFLFAAKATLYF